MEELLENLRKTTTHCSEEEYDNLLGYIKLCETSLGKGRDIEGTAERVRQVNKFYFEKINLDPEYYKFTEDYSYIFEIRTIFDKYWDTLRDFPHNYIKQIQLSLDIYKKIDYYVNK